MPESSQSADDPLLYTIGEAGRTLRAGRTKINELIGSGELRSVKIGRSRRVPVAALHEYVAKLQRESA